MYDKLSSIKNAKRVDLEKEEVILIKDGYTGQVNGLIKIKRKDILKLEREIINFKREYEDWQLADILDDFSFDYEFIDFTEIII